jgi:histidinol-phosphatase
MADHSTELDAARQFARAGGRIAMRHFRRDPEASRKHDGTWVTVADRAVESELRELVARSFPEHNVLGEEEGLSRATGGPPIPGAPTWVVDPIDGTTNFMAGIPIWATLVALRVDRESVVGVAHAPGLGETYDAAVGLGARMNDESISVDPIASLEEATVLYADASDFPRYGLDKFFEELTTRATKSRGFGDFWGHVLVARGAAHVMVEPELSVWDVAALQPIVAEAGGKLTTLTGAPYSDSGSCLTTNGALHDEVLALARGLAR